MTSLQRVGNGSVIILGAAFDGLTHQLPRATEQREEGVLSRRDQNAERFLRLVLTPPMTDLRDWQRLSAPTDVPLTRPAAGERLSKATDENVASS
jgi:hypothetical protein